MPSVAGMLAPPRRNKTLPVTFFTLPAIGCATCAHNVSGSIRNIPAAILQAVLVAMRSC
jgi:hypothetical protein